MNVPTARLLRCAFRLLARFRGFDPIGQIRAGEHKRSRLFVFVRFFDDRRLALVVRFGAGVFVLVIIGVSRRHRVAHDVGEPPLGRGKILRDAMGHVGSLLDVATFMRGCYRAGAKVRKSQIHLLPEP
jgi:hypothetical protein